jgi:hypothetical protein
VVFQKAQKDIAKTCTIHFASNTHTDSKSLGPRKKRFTAARAYTLTRHVMKTGFPKKTHIWKSVANGQKKSMEDNVLGGRWSHGASGKETERCNGETFKRQHAGRTSGNDFEHIHGGSGVSYENKRATRAGAGN